MTLEEFKQMLSDHDWYFNSALDINVLRRGQATSDLIHKVLAENRGDPKYMEAYKSEAPYYNRER